MQVSTGRIVSLIGAAALSAALGACSTVNTTTAAGPANPDGTVPFTQVITNGWLNAKTNIVKIRESTVNGDMKRVAVEVYNDRVTTQRFSYRFDWADASGMPVRSATESIKSVTIQAKETIPITTVAPSPQAVQWRLTFYDAK